ncbi:MAG TPA: hypothetical protein VGM17_17530 [Rhizomicrobium sp.]|jgi:hypothetical protein
MTAKMQTAGGKEWHFLNPNASRASEPQDMGSVGHGRSHRDARRESAQGVAHRDFNCCQDLGTQDVVEAGSLKISKTTPRGNCMAQEKNEYAVWNRRNYCHEKVNE